MKVLEQLTEDKHYYGRLGKMYRSNSDIDVLLNNPKLFGINKATTVPMVEGRYFHVSMLEPHKLDLFEFVNASNRSTNIYKDALKGKNEPLLLQKEKETLDRAISTMKDNKEFSELIYADGNEFEVPAITKLFGMEWKGKADIVHADYILDIKTTSDIRKFRKSAWDYNYDSQAYIYQKLFNRPMRFLVVDKKTRDLAIYDVSEEFIERGEAKVAKATEVYDMFFGPHATHDVNSYIKKDFL
jgi:hypothetical protein